MRSWYKENKKRSLEKKPSTSWSAQVKWRRLAVPLALLIMIWIAGQFPSFIEKYYTNGVYPFTSRLQRFLLGWIPFSIGDMVYLLAILYLIWQVWHLGKMIFSRQINTSLFVAKLYRGVKILLWIIVYFYLSWGLNYSRQGIAYQLQLDVQPYSLEELDTLATALQRKLNHLAAQVSVADRQQLGDKHQLFTMGQEAYQRASTKYSFLQVKTPALKPSIFSYAGNYLGFGGYYNPFTGEGQVNTTLPLFGRPFITVHEMAHQAGYAKESEANFVAYLTAREHPSINYRYGIYFDMYRYAINEIYRRDTAMAGTYKKQLHPQVLNDLEELRKFHLAYQSKAEDYFMWIFNQFLKVNRQPAGTASYNQVVAWLMAYRRKVGDENL